MGSGGHAGGRPAESGCSVGKLPPASAPTGLLKAVVQWWAGWGAARSAADRPQLQTPVAPQTRRAARGGASPGACSPGFQPRGGSGHLGLRPGSLPGGPSGWFKIRWEEEVQEKPGSSWLRGKPFVWGRNLSCRKPPFPRRGEQRPPLIVPRGPSRPALDVGSGRQKPSSLPGPTVTGPRGLQARGDSLPNPSLRGVPHLVPKRQSLRWRRGWNVSPQASLTPTTPHGPWRSEWMSLLSPRPPPPGRPGTPTTAGGFGSRAGRSPDTASESIGT